MGLLRAGAFLLFAGALCPAQTGSAAEDAPAPKPKVKTIDVAIIVHPKNPVRDLAFADLRAILKLERQFWPNKKRCVLYLRPSKSKEHAIMLDKVYKMSNAKFQKYWVAKLFSGQIPAKPAYVPTPKTAGSRVRASLGAVSFVLAHDVPKGVRVLKVDGKLPGEAGYPLSVPAPRPEPPPPASDGGTES